MLAKVDELGQLLGPEVLVQPRAGFFREAFCAAYFARARGAEFVRLIYPDERPDFELRTGDREEAFEVVEADTFSRRRDQEYRREALSDVATTPFPEEEWLTPDQAWSMLRAAAEKKADGRYDRSCRLLIYLNPIEFGIHQSAIEAAMGEATKPARGVFEEVWVLWKGQAYRAW